MSTEHTRQASWHLSTIASKCLHLSYQIPSSSSSALANLFHLTNPHDLQSPSKASSTSHILANALSTAPASEQFLKGVDDVYIVLLWIAIWTFFREFVIRFIGGPIGRYGGIKKSGALLRFGEQGYDVISHVLALTFGFYIMQNQDSGYRNMNLEGLWKGYPHYKLNASIKLYYLCQMGFWLQQVLTLHLEKRRKDYTQVGLHSKSIHVCHRLLTRNFLSPADVHPSHTHSLTLIPLLPLQLYKNRQRYPSLNGRKRYHPRNSKNVKIFKIS